MSAELLVLGKLSLDLHRAQKAANVAKAMYHEAWRKFELDGDDPELYGPDEYRIHRGSERWDEVIAATNNEYTVWQKAKAESYKVKRRWVSACRKAEQEKDK